MDLPTERRLQRARSFDTIADLFDRGRREPPAWLYDTLFAELQMPDGPPHVLDIGCGSGKSTLPMARRGARILALEMGANLARLAHKHLAAFANVEVLCTQFENWRPSPDFDLVAAITAWHWLDPEMRCRQAAAALKPGGLLAFTATEHVLPRGTIRSSTRFSRATPRWEWRRIRGRPHPPTPFPILAPKLSGAAVLKTCA